MDAYDDLIRLANRTLPITANGPSDQEQHRPSKEQNIKTCLEKINKLINAKEKEIGKREENKNNDKYVVKLENGSILEAVAYFTNLRYGLKLEKKQDFNKHFKTVNLISNGVSEVEDALENLNLLNKIKLN